MQYLIGTHLGLNQWIHHQVYFEAYAARFAKEMEKFFRAV